MSGNGASRIIRVHGWIVSVVTGTAIGLLLIDETRMALLALSVAVCVLQSQQNVLAAWIRLPNVRAKLHEQPGAEDFQ